MGTPEQQEVATRATERRRRRYPVHDDPLPPLDRVVMTHLGAVIFTDITGELADNDTVEGFYPEVSSAGISLLWGTWREPTHDELVKAWPGRWPADTRDRARGWWQPTIEELRVERRMAAPRERALQTKSATAMGG
jgi:hypothetical protein